jgi:threonine dehydrogenase-like Zn-dependent dehydrogenase
MASAGKINLKPLVTHRLPLERTEQAMELVAGYADGVVKAVVQVCDAA